MNAPSPHRGEGTGPRCPPLPGAMDYFDGGGSTQRITGFRESEVLDPEKGGDGGGTAAVAAACVS